MGGGEKFRSTDEGSIDKYLGVNIEQLDGGSFEMSQPFFIERITTLLGIENDHTGEKITPVDKPLLNKDLNGVPRKYQWNYCAAIGMLTYLIGSVRPNIVMAVHQCARFSKKQIHLHEQTVTKTGRYLIGSKTEGIVYNLDKSKGWKVYVDANFDGGWDPDNSLDANMLYSCTGFVICYVSCPVLWTRKLQT